MDTSPQTIKNAANYYCELCDFECSKKSEWDRHTQSFKHIKYEKKYNDGLTKQQIKTFKT